MPKCKNVPKSYYTGKEKSPKGLGYCAKKERMGTKKQGKDRKLWIVEKRADSAKLWRRYSSKKVTKKKKHLMKGGVGEDAARIVEKQMSESTNIIKNQIATSTEQMTTKIDESKNTLVSLTNDLIKKLEPANELLNRILYARSTVPE